MRKIKITIKNEGDLTAEAPRREGGNKSMGRQNGISDT
jgi:hypothetical protein